MKPNANTRKPVDELTAADLETYPLWEYALDEEDIPGQDETWVRPVDSEVIPKDQYSQLVATDFTMSDGSKCLGFTVVTTAEQPVALTPAALLFNGKYCCLPLLTRPDWDLELRDQLHELAESRDVFLISFSLRICVAAEKNVRAGTVE